MEEELAREKLKRTRAQKKIEELQHKIWKLEGQIVFDEIVMNQSGIDQLLLVDVDIKAIKSLIGNGFKILTESKC